MIPNSWVMVPNAKPGTGGGGGSGITINSTTITGGTSSHVLYDNAGTVGEAVGVTISSGNLLLTPVSSSGPAVRITGALATSSANIGYSLVGTLNTVSTIDGAAFFSNITNTASGAGTTLLDLQINSASVFSVDTSGNILMTGANEISSATSLTLEQTSDVFGATAFVLQNRNGANGAIFEQLGTVSVVDFVFNINGSGGFNGQGNMRYERRTSDFKFSSNTAFEFQIGNPAHPQFVIGDTVQAAAWDDNNVNVTFQIAGASNVVSDLTWNITSGSLTKTARLESRSGQFMTTKNTTWELQIGTIGHANAVFCFGDTVDFVATQLQFSQNTTGAGTPLFGSNSPAVTNTAPYTWIKAISSDGSQVYIPAWK